MNARIKSGLANLNIVPSCRVQVTDLSTDPPRYKTVATCVETPRDIARAAKKAGIADTFWVYGVGGRTLQIVKNDMAVQLKGD